MNEHPGLFRHSIHRFRSSAVGADDLLAVEEPLDIRLSNGGVPRSVAITMRTPGRDEDLARGFLFTEGIIGAGTRVRCEVDKGNVVTVRLSPDSRIDWQKLERHSYTSSSCGVCGKTSLEQVFTTLPFPEPFQALGINSAVLRTLPDKLRAAQKLFDRTGGIHATGLFSTTGELLHFTEDVGRHNALDKLIGHHFSQGKLPLDDAVLLLSGRASFELIQKAGMAGIRIVAAVGAPSSLAVQLAEEIGITLVGFLRQDGFNCYTKVDRIGHSPPI